MDLIPCHSRVGGNPARTRATTSEAGRHSPSFLSSNLRFHYRAISLRSVFAGAQSPFGRYSLGRNLPSVDVPRRRESRVRGPCSGFPPTRE
jgi:hypothetical protein